MVADTIFGHMKNKDITSRFFMVHPNALSLWDLLDSSDKVEMILSEYTSNKRMRCFGKTVITNSVA